MVASDDTGTPRKPVAMFARGDLSAELPIEEVPLLQVAEIESKIKSGYYSGHGFSSVKEDIIRMCHDAIK
ncbi:hypothetical protein RIF29_19707 [Crotalaria pallida]|uniref:Uncharacterized protein n=1 Tax=Crotalaria pallida TaxID=3830 RepID=A0AAN9F439_CROPI